VLALATIDSREDSALIAEVLAGNDEAFRVLVERYQERVLRMLAKFTRDRMEAEDLGQDVFVKVFRKLHTFQQDSAFYTWVYRIAVNTATDYLARRSRRRLRLVEDEAMLDAPSERGEGAAAAVLDEEMRRVTRQVLDELPEKYRTILILREYEDLSYIAMSEVLGCSIGTVESRLFRARQRFKEALERMHPELVPQLRGGRR
jgi:RNA polymerase sigma-70 factor (ECF subfamily)